MKRLASRSNSFMRALACAAVVLVVPPAVVGACGSDAEIGAPPGSADGGDEGTPGDAAPPPETEDAEAGVEAGRPEGGRTLTACAPRVRDPGSATPSDGGADLCASDDACDADGGGRCAAPTCLPSRALGARCTYDACTKDADCGPGGVCGCGAGFAGQNVCLGQSTCQTNDDCGASQICARSHPCTLIVEGEVCSYCNAPIVDGTETAGPANGGSSVGYFCTTPSDLCRPGATPDGGNQGVCSYFPARQLWDFDFGP